MTFVELMIALIITAILLAAITAMADALGTLNESSDDRLQTQSEVRYAVLRLTDLIKHANLICSVDDVNNISVWRSDINGDGAINAPELVYVERFNGGLRIVEFTTNDAAIMAQVIPLASIQNGSTRDALTASCTERVTSLISQCNNISFQLDVAPPWSNLASISFVLSEGTETYQCEVKASLRGRADDWLDDFGNVTNIEYN